MDILDKAFLWVLYSSFTSTVIILMVLLAKKLSRNRLKARACHTLWFLVLIRLLLPFTPESNLSVFNFFPKSRIAPIVYHSSDFKGLVKDQVITNDNEIDLMVKQTIMKVES